MSFQAKLYLFFKKAFQLFNVGNYFEIYGEIYRAVI